MRSMEIDEARCSPKGMVCQIYRVMAGMILRDRYKVELAVCLSVGILFGCVTQSVYGGNGDWQGLTEAYCAGFWPALLAVAPVTIGLIAALFAAAPFEFVRLLIYPASAVRGMGLGALICGAVQRGSLRELCFASLVLLPYAVASCVTTVYAGEYALGWRESFTGENEGMTRSLLLHTLKMLCFYLALAALTCVVFAVSCVAFGTYLM